jgi:ATP-binding cassette subfamily F protein 3
MSVINAGGLTKYYGADFIFGNVSFQVARGDKIGLVGVNGAGKSTLLKIIAGLEEPSAGGVYMARGTRTAYLAQEARFSGERTLWQEMEAALEHLNALKSEMAKLEEQLTNSSLPDWDQKMEHYGELMHRFEHGGGYEIDNRIERILQGLSFNEAQYHQPVAQFSGGQKTRAALGAVLLSDPDLLMLDEPTNHLDLAALEWLERFLKSWEGSLIVISHDRYFLDKVTTRTLDLAFGRLEDYPAGYNKFLQLKAERLELQMKHFQAQQDFIAKTEEFIRRFKAGQRSKEARGRERRLERLKAGQDRNASMVDRVQQQKKVHFKLTTETRSGEMVLRLEHLAIGFPTTTDGGRRTEDGGRRTEDERPTTKDGGRTTNDQRRRTEDESRPLTPDPRPLIKCPELEMSRGQRIALIGPNGSGKTTLLRTIVGEHPPLRGMVRLGHKVVINYYAQAHEGLRMDATVLDEVWRAGPQLKETQIRTLLGRFLFSGDDVFKRVGDLSGGERGRVALAQLMLLGGNLLVLDEPTNHLDIDAREALESVLNDYNGSILFVSHDRYFIDAVADTIWAVDNGTITAFDGTYSEYMAVNDGGQGSGVRDQRSETGDRGTREKAQKAEKLRTTDNEPRTTNHGQRTTDHGQRATSNGQPTTNNRQPTTNNGQRTNVQSKEDRKRQRKLASLEEEIASLEAELKQIEAEMTSAGERGDVEKVTALGLQHVEVQEMLTTRYDEWSAVAG